MEQEFQTSFIPKKPIAEERVVKKASFNFANFLGILIFLVALISAGGVYLWKATLNKKVADAKQSLKLAQDKFEIQSVQDLQTLDKRLTSGNELLENHIIMAPIFAALQQMTLQSVRFTKFAYSLSSVGNSAKTMDVKMSGAARTYNALAVQADILGKNKYFRDPIFSNLSLDDKGNILFDVQFTLDPIFLSYLENLKRTSTAEMPTSDITTNIEPSELDQNAPVESPVEGNNNQTPQ